MANDDIQFRYPPPTFVEAALVQRIIGVQRRGMDEPAMVRAGELSGSPNHQPVIPETTWDEAFQLGVWWGDAVKRTREGETAIAHPKKTFDRLILTMNKAAKDAGFKGFIDAHKEAGDVELPVDLNAIFWTEILRLGIDLDSAKGAPDAKGAWDVFVGTVKNMPAAMEDVVNFVSKKGTEGVFFVARTLGGAIGTVAGTAQEGVFGGGMSGTVKLGLGVVGGFVIWKLFFDKDR